MRRTTLPFAIALLVFAALPGPAPAQNAPPDSVSMKQNSAPDTATRFALIFREGVAMPRLAGGTARVISTVAAGSRHAPVPTKRDRIPPMPFELIGLAALASTKRKSGDDDDTDEGDGAKSTGPNTTDAAGVDSNWRPPAGVDPKDATPHLTPEVTDPGYAARRAQDALNHGEEVAKEDRLPQVLTGGYDVRRGEKVYRIPAGTVIEEAELTEDEWDHVVREKLVRGATYAEVIASKQKASKAETDAKLLEQRKEQIGVSPKTVSGNKPPAGAELVADLALGRAEVENAQVSRSIAREEVARGTSERAKMLSGKK